MSIYLQLFPESVLHWQLSTLRLMTPHFHRKILQEPILACPATTQKLIFSVFQLYLLFPAMTYRAHCKYYLSVC